jgi:hypothetical protein
MLFSQTELKKQYKVTGTVTRTIAYCGGIAPTTEMVAESMKKRPYVGKTFYIRKGKINSTKQSALLKVTADSMGRFVFNLPPGQYIFIQADQLKPIDYNKITRGEALHIDASCLKQWWQTPYYYFEIKDKNIENLIFEFNKRCFVESDNPCIQYIGPMPP